ncbi:MAG TPA: two-component regulator propeller domain-containing protein, partial [Puia sp.]
MIMRWLLLACSLAVGSWGYSQVRGYPFTRLAGQDGLSNNHINVIFKDKEGFVWIGTNSGLNRYDGYTFKVFRHDDQDPSSLTDDHVGGIFEGPDNKLYISTGTGGINIYDPVTGGFEPHRTAWLTASHIPVYNLITILKGKDSNFYFVYSDSGVYRYDPVRGAVPIRSGIADNPVADAGTDGSGAFWLSYYDGLLERLDPARGTVTLRTDILKRQAQQEPYGYKLYIDGQDQLWLYAMDNLSGLWVFDPHTGGIGHFSRDSGTVRLSNNNISDVVQDDKGLIWIATDKGGIDLLDKGKMTVRYLQHSDEERSLPENTITSLFCDNTGGVWVGTLKKGVAYYQQNVLRFPLYRHQTGQAESLPYNDVNCFAEDGKGNLWIGTDGGGLIYFDRAGNRWLQYRHEKDNPNSIAGDVIISLLVDRRGRLWVGMYQGGLDRYDGRVFTHFRHRDQDSGSLADDGVYSLLEDAEGSMWVGTMRGGLDRMDIAKGRFYHNTVAMQHSIHSNYIPVLARDRASNLWVGTSYGVNVLVRSTGQYIYYTTENSKLSDNIIFSLICDRRGNMWVGTRRGLSVMRPGSDSFQVFTVKDGLPGNTIASVQEDGDGNLWVSSSGGLSKVGVTEDGQRLKIKCLNFDEYDGLQGREFNVGAGFRTREGELAFGGPEGFNLFRPESIGLDDRAPPVVLTGLQLYNKEVSLPASVGRDGALTLSYDQNNFTLEFAALSYINARKDRYAYRLEPFDKDWMTTDGRSRKAVYTNIDPGEYIFRVKASNSDGVWNDRGIVLRVVVKPPWWKTGFAYAAYVMAVLLILYLARLRIIRRAKARFALAEERREAMRVHELDRMKIKFFTNLSHEFRTPLSLILSPVDRLIRGAEDAGRRQLAMTIERNAKRLLHLVNQLLDMRKMETNELKLNMGRGDIASFIHATVDSFLDLAGERGIALSYEAEVEQLPALFDRDKVERILFNLLSNAFKFTPTGGSIGVRLAVLERDEKGTLLEIRVSDTGIGIPAELQGRIFESFFQGDSPGHIRNQGTGIGLAITREFVEMHGGTIKVESEPDKGSCFTVLLPVEMVAG